MPDSNLPASGTADDTPLSLEEGVSLLSGLEEKDEPEADTGKAPPPDEDEDTPAADKPDKEDEPEQEPEDEAAAEEDDTTPDWDKPDAEGEKAKDEAKPVDGYASPTTKVKLEDGSEITVGDLVRNNMFQADYTRKTQAVSQEREALHQRFAQVQQFEQQLAQTNELTIDILAKLIPPEPDPTLRAQDPIGWIEARGAREDAINSLRALYENQQHIRNHGFQQLTQAQQQEAKRRQGEEVDALLTKMPQLRDPKKRESFTADVVQGMTKDYGFAPQELQTLEDHRVVMMAADALRYRRLMANKGQAKQKIVSNKGPVTRSTGGIARPVASAAMDEKKALERLSKTGSMDDAVELLMARNRRAKK